jgi:hypothetical protein
VDIEYSCFPASIDSPESSNPRILRIPCFGLWSWSQGLAFIIPLNPLRGPSVRPYIRSLFADAIDPIFAASRPRIGLFHLLHPSPAPCFAVPDHSPAVCTIAAVDLQAWFFGREKTALTHAFSPLLSEISPDIYQSCCPPFPDLPARLSIVALVCGPHPSHSQEHLHTPVLTHLTAPTRSRLKSRVPAILEARLGLFSSHEQDLFAGGW